MISILIPVYNYSIVDLVTKLYTQLEDSSIPFELICLDDGSDENYITSNKTIETYKGCSYKRNTTNIGRTLTRQNLANMATYNWLLFLDADVIPKSEVFIQQYIAHIDKANDAVFGGFAYQKTPPKANNRLRWNYGRQQEQKLAVLRNKTPFKIIISANFLIKRNVFLEINSQIKQRTYGLDNVFGSMLKQSNVKVFHIDNEVYHLGLETNAIYLKKKEDSAIAVLSHYKTNKMYDHQNDLLNVFITSKRFGINYLFKLVYKLFGNTLKRHLIGNNPSITLLQLYRISFMCYKDLNSEY